MLSHDSAQMQINRRRLVDKTRKSLLERVKNKDDSAAWREFFGLYSPLLMRYARARGLSRADSEDATQECMQILVKSLPEFEYDRKAGKFRNWLGKIINNKINRMLSKRRPGRLGTTAMDHLPDTADQDTTWERLWQREHLKYCLGSVKGEVAPTTYQAFKLSVLDDKPVSEVCAMLGVNRNQVYLARARVLNRLKGKMKDLVGYKV